MFTIAPTVTAWLDAGRDVLLARVLDSTGLAGRDAAAVAAWTSDGTGDGGTGDGGPVGSPLAARARDVLRESPTVGAGGRVEVAVADDEAEGVGLACGGRATVLVQHATDLPVAFWAAVRRGDPVALADSLDPPHSASGGGPDTTRGAPAETPATSADTATDTSTDTSGVTSTNAPTGTTAFTASEVPARFARVFGRGVSQVAVVEGETLTTYWPRTRLLIVGGGPVASALLAQADLLGWRGVVAEDLPTALDLLAGYGGADGVVVLSHDREVDGPVLAAAIASPVGYVGAMGSRHTQAARAEWFAAHEVREHLDRIHGPAGLDIGGFGPPEIALSIVAEIVAERSGRAARA